MKENVKRTLTEKKTILGFEIADLIGILLLLIPFVISLLPITYLDQEAKFKIAGVGIGTKDVMKSYNLIPGPIPSVCSIAFYASLIVRYNFFKKENLFEIIVSVVRTFLICWTLAALLKPITDSNDPMSMYLLIAAVVLSWLGMKTIAGYSWVFFIVAATMNYVKINQIYGGIGSVFIITLAISLFLQIKDLTKIKDFVSDFKVSTSPYTDGIKNDINTAARDVSKKAAYATDFVKQTASTVAGVKFPSGSNNAPSASGVQLNLDALDVNKDGVVDEKDFTILAKLKDSDDSELDKLRRSI